MDSDFLNKQAYETVVAVQDFGLNTLLQKPEEAIREILRPSLSSMSMLDIGVGAGRTTPHFAPLVREYVGFDYSQKMVEEARKRFSHIRFEIADATDMKGFTDDSFDFLLFSYNGIDAVSHEQRLNVFKEVRRVGKSSGWFAFSSHNLQGVRKMFTIQVHRNPKRFWISLRRCVLTRLFNPLLSVLQRNTYAIIDERAHFLRLKHYYIRPHAQVRQLKEAGFYDIRLFGLEGRVIPEEEWDTREDNWVYYLSRIHK